MNNFDHYITPKEAAKLHNAIKGNKHVSVAHYEHLSKNEQMCEVCETEDEDAAADKGEEDGEGEKDIRK